MNEVDALPVEQMHSENLESDARLITTAYENFLEFQEQFDYLETTDDVDPESLNPPWDKIAEAIKDDKRVVRRVVDRFSSNGGNAERLVKHLLKKSYFFKLKSTEPSLSIIKSDIALFR